MKKLQVRVGTDIEKLIATNVNDEENPSFIQSDNFMGSILVRIKDFCGIPSDREPLKCTEYFHNKSRKFSIQVSGRFLKGVNAEELTFGAEFKKKINPPFGTLLGLKLARLIDPGLETDLYSDTPWLKSPLFCAMNVIQALKTTPIIPNVVDHQSSPLSINSGAKTPILDFEPDLETKHWPWMNGILLIEHCTSLSPNLKSSSQRRSFFKIIDNLKKVKIDPTDVYTPNLGL
jgi:hypothetical protein